MSARRRLLWICGLVAGICFCLGFLFSFELPKVRSWILVKINEMSEKELPLRILPREVRLHLIPLGITLESVRMIPKDDLKKTIDPFVIDRISVELSAFQLAQGRLRLRTVSLQGAHASLRIPKPSGSSRPPLEGLFASLSKAPIRRLEMDDIDLHLESAGSPLTADIRDLQVATEVLGSDLAFELSVASAFVLDTESKAQVRLQLETQAYLQRNKLTISEFKLRRGASYLIASGSLFGDTEQLKFTDAQLEMRASLQLDSLYRWAVKSLPNLGKIPPLRGNAQFEAKLSKFVDGQPDIDFRFATQGLYESRFFIDRLEAKGTFQQGKLNLPALTMTNPGATVVLREVDIVIPKSKMISTAQRTTAPPRSGPPAPVTAKFNANIPRADLHQFMKTLGLEHEVPVWLDLQAQVPCEGTLAPIFKLSCKGDLQARDLYINETKTTDRAIAALPKFDASGEFAIEAHSVTYKTEIRMPRSSGRSSGTIDYEKGFKIAYEADTLDFSDKTALANLRLDGSAKIKGVTEGNSHSAWLQMQLDGTDLWFEDYWLGNAKAEVSYRSGTLRFENFTGHYNTSRYTGRVAVDLKKKTISADAAVPFFDSRDLLKVFSRRVTLPFPVSGTGKAEAKVWGPLEFTKLSYDLRSTLFRGSVAKETFDAAHFDVRSRNGEVTAERVLMARDDATISLTGTGHPDGSIQTLIRGRGLRLEESTNVTSLGMNISGVVDFDMDVVGYVLGPSTDLRGSITKSAIGDQGVADSSFRLKFREQTLEGGGQFLGNLVDADFILPLRDGAPFRLEVKTRDWNYAPLFGAINGPGAKKDYDGRLTCDISLAAASGGFWNSTGRIQIPSFTLKRGSLQMTSPQPIQLSMKDGRLEVQNFFLEGDGTFLRVIESPHPVSKVDLQVNGKLDLSLMALMMPFFEEIRGLLAFAFNLRAGPETSGILGSVYVDKGYLKLFGFPHSFEEIKADFLFNQKKVLVNSLKADLSGGRVTADGSIELAGSKNYPINLTAVVDKVNLAIPAGISTVGSGRLTFTGSWFPFLMKGHYDVQSGLVSQLGGGDAPATSTLQRSMFLPRGILADSFEAIEMDLKVNATQPIDVKAEIPIIMLGIEGKATGKLSITGTPSRFRLGGSVTADRDTKAIFRDNTFELTSGLVNFNDPNEINPNLYVVARSRVNGYDVNLVYQGTLNKPDLNLTSTPALSEVDIMSLLAFGVPGEDVQEGGNKLGLIPTGVLKQNPAAQQFKKATGFDVSTSLEGVNNVAVPKITATRKFTPKFGVSASQSLGTSRKTEAKAQYQLSKGVSTILSWEGQNRQESLDATNDSTDTADKLGLDIEYRFEFK